MAGAITALMTGRAYRKSSEVAAAVGPYERFAENRDPHLHVMRKHRDASYELSESLVEERLAAAAKRSWDEAVELGQVYGYRNAQATVLAPTGPSRSSWTATPPASSPTSRWSSSRSWWAAAR